MGKVLLPRDPLLFRFGRRELWKRRVSSLLFQQPNQPTSQQTSQRKTHAGNHRLEDHPGNDGHQERFLLGSRPSTGKGIRGCLQWSRGRPMERFQQGLHAHGKRHFSLTMRQFLFEFKELSIIAGPVIPFPNPKRPIEDANRSFITFVNGDSTFEELSHRRFAFTESARGPCRGPRAVHALSHRCPLFHRTHRADPSSAVHGQAISNFFHNRQPTERPTSILRRPAMPLQFIKSLQEICW